MNLGFLKLINEIEAELKIEYMGGAIRWADEKYDNAWSKAMNRFDKALSISIERMDYQLAKAEGQLYKETVIKLLTEYKQEKGIQEVDAFLEALKV